MEVSHDISITTLIEEASESIPVYLHKEIHISDGGKASMLKANTKLTSKLLHKLEKIHGENCILTIGYQPLSSGENKQKVKRATGILMELKEIAHSEAQKPTPTIFANYSSLIMAAKQAGSIFSYTPATTLENLIIENAKYLSQKRDKLIFGNMLLRSTADVLAMLYLDEIDIKKKSKSDEHAQEKKRGARITAMLLKDVSYARDLNLQDNIDLDEHHATISACLLLGKSTDISIQDLENVTANLKHLDEGVSNVIRIVLEHENMFTKSILSQGVIRGFLFSQWLLQQKNPEQKPLKREILQKTGYFNPTEISHFLDLSVLCTSPDNAAILKNHSKKKNSVRITMFEKFLEGKKAHLPLPADEYVDKCFLGLFSSFPDFHPVGFQFLRHLVLYKNQLLLKGVKTKEVNIAVNRLEERLRNILL